MMRIVLAAAAFLSPFFFPFPATLVLAALASLYLPPIALLVGILTDLLYYTPGAATWPIATILGLFISLAALLVRRFLKARIIAG